MKRIFALLTVLCLLGGCAAPAAISSAAETPSASSASSVPQASTAEVSSKEEAPPAAPAPSVPEPSEPPVFVSDIDLAPPEEFSLSAPLCFWLGQTFRQVADTADKENIACELLPYEASILLGEEFFWINTSLPPVTDFPLKENYPVSTLSWSYGRTNNSVWPSLEGLPELFPGLPLSFTIQEFRNYLGIPQDYPPYDSGIITNPYCLHVKVGTIDIKLLYADETSQQKTVYLSDTEPRPTQPYFVEPHRCEKELPEKMPLSASSPACDWLDYGGYELAQALSCEEVWHPLDGHPRAFLLKGEHLSPFFVPSSTADKGYVLLQREYGKYESAPSGLPDICAGLSFTAGRDEILSFFGLPADHPLGYGDGVDLKVRWGDREYSFWFDKDLPQQLNAVKIEMI